MAQTGEGRFGEGPSLSEGCRGPDCGSVQSTSQSAVFLRQVHAWISSQCLSCVRAARQLGGDGETQRVRSLHPKHLLALHFLILSSPSYKGHKNLWCKILLKIFFFLREIKKKNQLCGAGLAALFLDDQVHEFHKSKRNGKCQHFGRNI